LWRRRQFAARRLDAAKRAAKFINLALVGQFLALGDLDQFKHFVEMIDHLLERLGDFRGVRNGLADGRGFGRTKIGGLDPRLWAQRFGAALFRTMVALRFTLRP